MPANEIRNFIFENGYYSMKLLKKKDLLLFAKKKKKKTHRKNT